MVKNVDTRIEGQFGMPFQIDGGHGWGGMELPITVRDESGQITKH